MNEALIKTHGSRARQARFAVKFGKTGNTLSRWSAIVGLLLATLMTIIIGASFISGIIVSISLLLLILSIWYERHLKQLPPAGQDYTNRLTSEALGQLKSNQSVTPKRLYQAYAEHWQARFINNRLLLHSDSIEMLISDDEAMTATILQRADQLRSSESMLIDVRHIFVATLLTNEAVQSILQRIALQESDVLQVLKWLQRVIDAMEADKPYYGGIGRDWASGFTPRLNAFGANISQAIQRGGAHFGTLLESPGVHAIRAALSQGASTIALIGGSGAGKTSHIYALAQSLLAESKDPQLRHKQVVGLDASSIISSARHPGDIEHIMNTLLNEAHNAGNIILYLDNAELFFQDGHGSFDATRLLQPAAQSKTVKIVMAMTPRDYQVLKNQNPSFASVLTPINMQEPDERTAQEILEDTALAFEHRQKTFISYQAVKTTIPLSDRYFQDMARPGRGIRLLEQALAYPDNGVITDKSIKQSIEGAQGVKLSTASQAESETLLNLENELHKRMINQSRAVNVVSSALRRARAGVTNPNRPLGSFLFLGPTGVGKTELAKSLSATNFGSQDAMIRLDMSEYQHENDVARLLSDGADASNSLLMQIRQQPYSVVLLDEIEKTHPNILNLLLQLLDEGQLSDKAGKAASFKDAIIIATSNAGAQTIREQIEAGKQLKDFEEEFTNQLINNGQFKPELLNRFDEIVLFRPLTQEELTHVVTLMIQEVNRTLSAQNIQVALTPAAIAKIVHLGYDPRLGARPMRRVVQRTVEDTIAKKILAKEVNTGDNITLDEVDIIAQS